METKRSRETNQKRVKVLIIVQARMGATRFPGKPLKLVKGKTLLSYLIDRLKKVQKADEIVIATTHKPQDDQIAAEANTHSIGLFRGSEENVLQRYYQAAKQYNADVIVRVTADCPLIDPHIVDQCITYFLEHSEELDYYPTPLN